MDILEHYEIDVEGKNVVILGRSDTVGKPLALLFLKANATVTICHSKTENVEMHTRNADILVSAVGIPKYVTKDMVKEGAVVIDVGINDDGNGGICGDVDFEAVEPIASAITPVPRGIGCVTTAILLNNM
jgi:methylenetetrahydrofolate dehydrogenase (NADP+)/methenyltetrahydrofolate cyclohydrolase